MKGIWLKHDIHSVISIVSSISNSLSGTFFMLLYTVHLVLLWCCSIAWMCIPVIYNGLSIFYLEDKGRHFENVSPGQITFVSKCPWLPGTYTFSNHCFSLSRWPFKAAGIIPRRLRGWDFVWLPDLVTCSLFSECQDGWGTSVQTRRRGAREQRQCLASDCIRER